MRELSEEYELFRKNVFKEITRRTAQKIRDAHQRGDDLRKCIEFRDQQREDGADLMQAITITNGVFPEVDLQQELTEILEHVLATQGRG
jgi:hypothetical protein